MSNAIFGEKKEWCTLHQSLWSLCCYSDEKLEKIVLVQAPNGAWFPQVEI